MRGSGSSSKGRNPSSDLALAEVQKSPHWRLAMDAAAADHSTSFESDGETIQYIEPILRQ